MNTRHDGGGAPPQEPEPSEPSEPTGEPEPATEPAE